MRASDFYIGFVESIRMRANDTKNEFRGLNVFHDFIIWCLYESLVLGVIIAYQAKTSIISLSHSGLGWLYVFSLFPPRHLVTPVWGDFMFSVRFRRLHVRHVRRRKNFSLSRQNRLGLTFDIWHKEYMGLGKCTGWPFPDLDPRLRLCHWLAKICLSAR